MLAHLALLASLAPFQALERPPGGAGALHWLDLDRDGDVDLVAIDAEGRVRLLRQESARSFVDVSAASGLDALRGVSALVAADVDGDALPDLVLGDARGLRILRQTKGGAFEEHAAVVGLERVGEVRELARLDLDGDGGLDLLVSGASGKRLYRDLGRARFEELDLGLAGALGASVPAPALAGASGAADAADAADAPESAAGASDRGPAQSSRAESGASTSAGASRVGLGDPAGTSRSASPGSIPASIPTAGTLAGVACIKAIVDQALSGSCIEASSIPELGTLHPLSEDFNIDAATGRVGMGTTSPTAGLHLSSIDGLLATGTFNQGVIPIQGSGVRMMWYPKKAAFRAGRAQGNEWDDANVGVESIGVGNAAVASGQASVALGALCVATGIISVALGNASTASGDVSTAMGSNTTASGVFSTAMGSDTTASGQSSTAIGNLTQASAFASTAMGDQTEASGSRSTAMGLNATASGATSTAMGAGTTASGSNSTAMGANTTASGQTSFASGHQTQAQSRYSFATGAYNLGGGSPSSWVLTDPLFEIGNGTSEATRANALTVLKNGNTGIGIAAPTFPLQVRSTSPSAVVRAEATATAGSATAVHGSTAASEGVGVLGSATSVSGTPIGVAGEAPANGYAGYFTGRSYTTTLGVGVLAPAVPLHVGGGSDASASGGGELVLGGTNGQNLAFDGNEIMARNNGAVATLNLNVEGGDVVVGTAGQPGGLGIGASPDARLLVRSSIGEDAFRVRIDTATRMVIRDNGGVGIGSNYSGLPANGLRVAGNVGVAGADPGSWALAVNGDAAKPGGGSWAVFSDARLKRDVEELDGALERLLELRGVSFEYRDPEAIGERAGRQVGFIAQEVEQVFPAWVGEKDDGMKFVSISGFEALTVEALRELSARKDAEIAELRAGLERQRAELETLRGAQAAELASLRSLVLELAGAVRPGEGR